ncbi:hypothetical protein ACIQJT_21340 [Streptomyces sp. NPDC091972]|uniref:hypothetical protein n=1 Tax=Streptomyces sp. NPDC091972 TaxID=3366007 RepID=UPI0037FB814B
MRALTAALGSLTAVALTAGSPVAAHANEEALAPSAVDGELTAPPLIEAFEEADSGVPAAMSAELSGVDGEITNPTLFKEFDADMFAHFGAEVAVSAAKSDDDGVWKRYSWKCSSPAGAKFNISIGYRGPLSQTIYFNNHCSQKRSVRTYYSGQEPGGEPKTGSYCTMTVNPKTKGHKKFAPSNHYPWYKASSNC